MKYSIREDIPSDATEIEALLPRLADFDVPEHRPTRLRIQNSSRSVKE